MPVEPRKSETTRLVGRASELATLRGLVGEVAGGASALVSVSGASGLGKSRLAREALRLAQRAGFATLVSRATAYGEGTPFGAAVDALGPLLRALPEQERAPLLDDLPQLGLLFAGISLAPVTPMTDAALQRLVLIEGLCRLVERVTRNGPLVWVVDGLEGIDPASVELFQRLASALADRPVLLVATGEERGGQAMVALERACGDCGWQCGRIELQPLTDPDAVALAEDVLGGAAAESLQRLIRGRCAGTPLWVVATAQALLDEGIVDSSGVFELTGPTLPLPPGIDGQLHATIRGVEDTGRAILTVLAVAGGPLPLEVLDAWGTGPGSVARTVGDLARRRLVAWTGTGCELAHGLLRDVVLAHLDDTERRTTHAALARALRSRDADDPQVPEHVLSAGPLADAELMPGELIRGARRARSVGAMSDAYRFLQAALAAYPMKPDRAGADGLPPELTLQAEAGEVAGQLGEHDAARRHWERALALCTTAGLAVGVARAHRGLADLDWARGRLCDAQEHLGSAERALAGLEPGPELGEVLLRTHGGRAATCRRGGGAPGGGTAAAAGPADLLGTPVRASTAGDGRRRLCRHRLHGGRAAQRRGARRRRGDG